MFRLLLISSILLTGCATNDVVYTPQYCYTDQTIVKENNSTVSSQTVLECTDRPGQQTLIQRAGVDSRCEEFFYPEVRRGKTFNVRGVRCEKFDGTWEIIDINGNNS
jgi:hypothetical protein